MEVALLRGRSFSKRPVAIGALGALGLGALSLGALAIGRLVGKSRSRPLRVRHRDHHGIVSRRSHHSVEETVELLRETLHERGITLFALVDHSGEAARVGLKLRNTKLLVFGSPQAGTPLMAASPSLALDLPLKLLVWEDDEHAVWISFNSPEYLSRRHGLPLELGRNLGVVASLAEHL
jgi:uncharacterized protein (DUF302 family)